MSIATKIILGLIVLHLVIGFGWLVYKLSPRDKDRPEDGEDE
jgi:hypothetical protein